MRQETLTVIARVEGSAALSATRMALQQIAADRLPGSGARPRAFADPKLGIHFARLVLLHEPNIAAHGTSLVFESNFDSGLAEPDDARKAHLELLSSAIPETLLAAFEHCAGFPSDRSSENLAAWLSEHLVEATASYQGHTERDLRRIRLEQRLREVLLAFFERAPKAPPRELYRAARDYVRVQSGADPLLSGLNIDHPAPSLPDAATRTERLNEGLGVWFKNVSWRLFCFALSQLGNIFRWQRTDLEYDQRASQEAWTDADRRAYLELAENEDHGLQNALTHVVPVKSGSARLAVLRAAHGYINLMAKVHFDDIGQLGGIPTIHFAKWLLIDEGTRLLFFSNYDSSWESYLGDFVDRAPIGLNLAWTTTDRYPRTFLMALAGAKDEERFKAWSRAHQRPTQVFYAAYPELGIAALNNSTWIRCGMHHPPSNIDLPTWFRRLT